MRHLWAVLLAACGGASSAAWPASAGHVTPKTWQEDGGESVEPRLDNPEVERGRSPGDEDDEDDDDAGDGDGDGDDDAPEIEIDGEPVDLDD